MHNLPIAIISGRNYMRMIRSSLRDELNPFSIDETRFQELYRLPKGLIIDIINSLEEYLDHPMYHTAIPSHLKVLTTINYFATGGYQRQVGMNFLCNMSQTKVSECVRAVSKLLSTKLLNTHVHFPVTGEEMLRIKNRFFVKTGMPGVIGIVIKISGMKKRVENIYVNRKGFHSINVQIVCDDELRIINVNASYPQIINKRMED